MKKIFAFILCTMLLCAAPIVAFAEEGETTEPTVEEVLPETEAAPVVEEVLPEVEEKSITEEIVDYFKGNLEEFSVIGTLLGFVFFYIRDRGKINGTVGLLNNNAIAVAQNSANAVKEALGKVEDIAKVVMGYKEDFEAVLAEIRKNADEKKSTEETLAHVETFLKTAKLATLELSNEVAELLVLANIPNSKKDELYARHTKAVHELEAAEEVMSNDGKEA